jgi:hypothetical protein
LEIIEIKSKSGRKFKVAEFDNARRTLYYICGIKMPREITLAWSGGTGIGIMPETNMTESVASIKNIHLEIASRGGAR